MPAYAGMTNLIYLTMGKGMVYACQMKAVIALLILIMALAPGAARAAVSVQQVALLPWGTGDNAAGFQTGADVVLGPAALAAAPDGTLLLLDRVNLAVKRVDPATGAVTVALRLPDRLFFDLICDAGGTIYLLHIDRGVLAYAPDGAWLGENPLASALPAANGLGETGGTIFVTTPSGWRYPVYRDGAALTAAEQLAGAVEGVPVTGAVAAASFTAAVDGRSRGIIRAHAAGGVVMRETFIPFAGDLLTFVLLAARENGEAIVSVEQADAGAAGGVNRRLVHYGSDGSVRDALAVPPVYFAASEREFRVLPDGTVYHLLLAPAGAVILRLHFSNDADFPVNRDLASDYPPELTAPYHYNEHLLREPVAPVGSRSIARPTTASASVTRSEALVIAEAYRDLTWTAQAGNISADTVVVGDGHIIRTPDWVAPAGGARTSVPYKWGGFTSLDSFAAQQLANKYTGSDYTSDVSWSDNYCVGVDCSGFVSRCWRRSAKEGTTTLPTISNTLASFDDLKTGDIVNLAGSHVRLFWKKEENGTYTMIEAMGTYWRVMTRNYTAAALAAYTPLRYKNMTEVEAPVLVSVTNTAGNDLVVRWRKPTDSTVQNIKIYLSTTGSNYSVHDTVNAAGCSTTVTGLAAGTTYWLNATFANSSGREGLYSCAYIVRVDSGAGNAPVLLVDDEQRYGAHGLLPYYGQALAAAGYTYDACAAAAVTGDTVALADYWAVVWACGRGSSTGTPADTSLTSAERAKLQTYLLAGGNLLISGQEIAYDLGGMGLDNAWLGTYLKAAYKADDAGNDVLLTGTAGKILNGLTFELDEDNGLVNDGGAYDARWPDVIRATADTICTYSTNNAGGVSYKGTYGGGTDTAAMVYLAFSFECIKTTAGRNSVIQKVFGFFDVAAEDTRPVITVAAAQRVDPGGTLTIALTATDNRDTAAGLTWTVGDTDPAVWNSAVISEGAAGDTLTLAAKSVFNTDTITISVVDSDGARDTVTVVITVASLATPGYPELLRAASVAPGNAVTLAWTEDPAAYKYIVYRTTDGWSFTATDTVYAPAAGANLAAVVNTAYGFRIRAYNSVDTPSDSFSVMLPVRTSAAANTMLLVEDDTTTAAHRQLWTFADGLNAAGRGFDSARAGQVTAGTVALGDYGAVIWACGNDSADRGGALTTDERYVLKNYLDDGGDLFLSGNEVACDLYTADRDFLERYLKILYGFTTSNRFTLRPQTQGMLAGMGDWYIAAECTIAGESLAVAPYMIPLPDRSLMTDTALHGGRITVKYWNSGWAAGIDYTGGFGIEYDSGEVREAGQQLSKLVFFMFDAACINDTLARRGVMRRLVTYFDSTSIAGRVDLEGVGDTGATVTLYRVDHSETRTAGTDGMGRFAFDTVPAGNWQVDIVKSGFLASRSTVLVAAPGIDYFLPVTLLAGDANGDQRINILDACLVKSRVTLADFNQDGSVDDLDMEFVRTNFGTMSY